MIAAAMARRLLYKQNIVLMKINDRHTILPAALIYFFNKNVHGGGDAAVINQ